MARDPYSTRICRHGKFLREGEQTWFAKGFCYGPFEPQPDGSFLPPRERLVDDFRHMTELGANVIRIYHVPPRWVLDEAHRHGLRVFVDIPWEKHRCFLEDWEAMQRTRCLVRDAACQLGDHPALFAISVVNEIPTDVVRYQGRHRVAAFIDELIGLVKKSAPECLVTYVNYPSTEFLSPQGGDFLCFNVFIHDEVKLGKYLDRLQHLAGDRPVILGEYGIDTFSEGETKQAELLAKQIRTVEKHGLSGSFVFSFTDDWYTGGHAVQDWAFGVCDRDRSNKPSSFLVRDTWQSLSRRFESDVPCVSVVVCTYNGASTLRQCLESLMELNYPDYEVLLIDDGSTDNTAEIAAEFPQVICHSQENRGLSVARNVGAKLASGEIVAYTDSDCVADENWLRYLVSGMESQNADAIGGLNLSPADDGWVAKCVNASPGNPAHVMLDDQKAEHVPGCNMAFRRHVLLGLGGFDPQFRQAGDDVDICWRMLDANLIIGFAPAAMVWHHRRATLGAFMKQQRGYGRSEALVHFKHPQRCGTFGRSIWRGVIYGDAMMNRLAYRDVVYHGRFGSAPFQIIYRTNHYSLLNVALSLEWHGAACFLLLLALLFPALVYLPLAMWAITMAVALRVAATAPRPPEARIASWLLVGFLHIAQPIVRGWYRLTHLLSGKRVRREDGEPPELQNGSWKRHKNGQRGDLFWESRDGLGREVLLPAIVNRARSLGWPRDSDNAWADWDIKLVGDPWHDIEISTATEELGDSRRFTRISILITHSLFTVVLGIGISIWSVASIISGKDWAIWTAVVAFGVLLAKLGLSRNRCIKAGYQLITWAIAFVESGSHSNESTAEYGDIRHDTFEPEECSSASLENTAL